MSVTMAGEEPADKAEKIEKSRHKSRGQHKKPIGSKWITEDLSLQWREPGRIEGTGSNPSSVDAADDGTRRRTANEQGIRESGNMNKVAYNVVNKTS